MNEPKWDREHIQRVLYHVIRRYQEAIESNGCQFDELFDSAIYDVAIPTLQDNDWWPHD